MTPDRPQPSGVEIVSEVEQNYEQDSGWRHLRRQIGGA